MTNRGNRRFSLAAMAVACLFTVAVEAGGNRWTYGAPPKSACEPWLTRCTQVPSIALDPLNENVIYAVMDSGAVEPHGVWRSDDNGETWTRLGLRLGDSSERLLAIRVTPAGTLYVLSSAAFFRSEDGGSTWTRKLLPQWATFNIDLAVDPRNERTVWVAQQNFCLFGTCGEGGVFRSTDGGRSWRGAGLDEKTVDRIATDPSDSATLYAISGGHLYQTRNSGGSWKDVTPSGPAVASMVVVDPHFPATLYLSTGTFQAGFAGMYKSIDRGKTWRLLEGENLTGGGSNLVTVDALHPTNLLATTEYGYPIRSTNGGESWTRFDDGIRGVHGPGGPLQIVIAPSGLTFHMVYEDGWVFHYSLVPPRRRSAGK